jgi:hypothetical protein
MLYIATRILTGRQGNGGSITGKGQTYFASTQSKPALHTAQHSPQGIAEGVTPGLKRPEREAGHSLRLTTVEL